MNKILKNALVLMLITLIAGCALGLVYEITKDPIAAAQERAKLEAWQEVFPEAQMEDFTVLDVDTEAAAEIATELGVHATVDEVCQVEGQGYVVTVTDSDGYGGNITITLGITEDGTINGFAILSIGETAGLGMNATKEDFYGQYVGVRSESFFVSKDGGRGTSIDAISGATITSRAVTGAVNEGVTYFHRVLVGGEE